MEKKTFEKDPIKLAKMNGRENAFPDNVEFGLTKREFMAALILPALIAASAKGDLMEDTASLAVGFTDILLEELQES